MHCRLNVFSALAQAEQDARNIQARAAKETHRAKALESALSAATQTNKMMAS